MIGMMNNIYCRNIELLWSTGFDGALVDIDVNVETLNADVETIALDLVALLERSNTCAQIEWGNVTLPEPILPRVEELRYTSINNFESDMYFYHSDHLGSSSWITDASGAVNQHLQYLPLRQAQGSAFGEDFIYQRNSSWAVPYTFSGKEKDSETGYSYFGARYYDSDLSVWLSVDPMSDKYPNESPYCYAGWNPVMIIDPNGMFKDYYKNANGDVIYRPGHAKSVEVDGETYNNIGSTYSNSQFGNNYHYVQNHLVGITSSDKSFGEFLQNKKAYRNAISTASKYSSKTVKEVYMKAFSFGRSEMSKKVLALTFGIVGGIIGGEYLLAGGIISTNFWAGKAAISAGSQAIFNDGNVDWADVGISAVSTPGAAAFFGGWVDGNSKGISLIGYNKEMSNVLIDISTSAIGNKIGEKGFNSVQPFLKNGFEKGIMNATTTFPTSVLSTGLNKSMHNSR
jgi:RHS repeat-associated protein